MMDKVNNIMVKLTPGPASVVLSTLEDIQDFSTFTDLRDCQSAGMEAMRRIQRWVGGGLGQ